ncbi:hypothetical protein AVEN_3994-1 [Araneus ventricosus]|uniref:Uncharacterized protein n=1 Tax=Araneus ventricosus TaxID=182803 RepID=A0A4Y2RSM8_ARAVE|nr:hypothetical protein AVEN_3994-1 [Araneus ventricosus]
MTEQFVILIAIVIPQFPDCVTNKKWQRWSSHSPVHFRAPPVADAEALSTVVGGILCCGSGSLRQAGWVCWFPVPRTNVTSFLRRQEGTQRTQSFSFSITSLKINCEETMTRL